MYNILAYRPIARLGLALIFLGIVCVPAEGKRADVVVMKNGDRLTGEVKKLENGVLYLDTNYVSGSIGLDYLQVAKIESTGSYQVVLNNGERISGTIRKEPENENSNKGFKVAGPEREVHVSSGDVVNIESQKRSFWRQLKGAIDFGYNFTSGNSQTAFSSDGNATYRATKWAAGASFNTSFSGQSGGSSANLWEIQGTGERFLNRNSFLLALGDLLHSSQQDLNLRTTLGGGYGRYWVRTNHNSLRWITGLVYTHETFESGTAAPSQANIEGLLGAQYQLFQFDRYSVQSQLLVFPGLSDAGRIRSSTQNTLSIKLTNNFHYDLSFWDNFDSRPLLNSKKNELGISSSLGWSF